MSVDATLMTDKLYQYVLDSSLREPAVLKKLREETETSFSAHAMQSAPEQMQLIMLLLKMLNATRVLEVGTFTGYGALAMALALPKQGKVITCDVNEETSAFAQQHWKTVEEGSKIQLKLGPALQSLDDLLEKKGAGSFDFAYIDADKFNIIHYYEKSLKLLRQGGLVAIDNVLWDGKVVDSKDNEKSTLAIRAFNQALYEDDRVDITMIPIADGLSVARKK